MIETTESLPLNLPAPPVKPEDIQLVVKILSEGFWMTAEDIAIHSGKESGLTERKVRKVASAAVPQIVSYPGSPGYKLWQFCSIDEINHCIDAFESQGSDMLKRAVLYRQAYHRRFRGLVPQ